MTHLRDPSRSPRRAWLPYTGVYLGYDTARCDRRVYHSEAVEEHSIVNGAPTCTRCAAWAKAHLDALADPSPHGAKMRPTLAAFAASYRHRYPDLVVKTDEDFDLVIEWQQGAESPCHEVYVRIVQDGLRIVLDCDGGHSLTFDEERPTDSLTDAFIRNGAAPILAAPGTFAALVLERCLFRDSAIRPQSPDRLN